MKNQKGFSGIEALLILVIAGIIGGVGWYVWNAKKESDESLKQAAQTEIKAAGKKKEAARTDQKVDETANWKEVSFKSIKYSFKAPDGWTLNSLNELEPNNPVSDEYYSLSHEGIRYKAGTPASVTPKQYEPSLENGNAAFSIWVTKSSSANKEFYEETYKKEEFSGKTKSNQIIEKYSYVSTTDPEGLGDYKKGTKAIVYFVNVGDKIIFVRHVIEPGESDESQYTDKLVQTIEEN